MCWSSAKIIQGLFNRRQNVNTIIPFLLRTLEYEVMAEKVVNRYYAQALY